MNRLENENQEKKMDWIKIGKRLLFPHTVIVFLLFNLTVVGLIYIFMHHLEESFIAIPFYIVAFYTLVVVCARIPAIVTNVKNGVCSNKHAKTYLTDADVRMRVSMYRGLLINVCFAVFKIILGFIYHSSWLFAMAGYNVILSIMRFIVIWRSQKKGLTELEERRRGLQSYRVCGWLMMILNIAVSVIMFMVIVQKQTIEYHAIVTIGLAAYTFYCFFMAIKNFIKYRDRKNPVYATIKRVDLVKSIVSIFTLQVAMLTSFGNGSEFSTVHTANTASVDVGLMNTLTGIAVTIAINTIGALMIWGAKKDFREMKTNGEQ